MTTLSRTLSPTAQAQLRRQIIRLKNGGRYSGKKIAEIVGVTQEHVSRTWKAYQQEGEDGIKLKRRGRKVGAKRPWAFPITL